jgi:hypothetical protein
MQQRQKRMKEGLEETATAVALPLPSFLLPGFPLLFLLPYGVHLRAFAVALPLPSFLLARFPVAVVSAVAASVFISVPSAFIRDKTYPRNAHYRLDARPPFRDTGALPLGRLRHMT